MSEIPVTLLYEIYFTFRLLEVLGCSIYKIAAIWDQTPSLCSLPPDQLTAHLLAHDTLHMGGDVQIYLILQIRKLSYKRSGIPKHLLRKLNLYVLRCS
jgi:hypothetical protein